MGGRRGRMGPGLSRRGFLGASGLGVAALALRPGSALAEVSPGAAGAGFGPLVPDPGGLLDLPKGFQYRVMSVEGGSLSGGKPVPSDHDGMAAFPVTGGIEVPGHGHISAQAGALTVLVRNHELDAGESVIPVLGEHPYDPAMAPGGTTGIVVGPDRRTIADYVTASGTLRNCAGGPTPWGTWLTCEETRETDGDKIHGYVYEVLPGGEAAGVSDVPILDMGFFSHEATGTDPATGIVYLTEDDFRGEIPDDPATEDRLKNRASFLYRYLPDDRSKQPGALQKGGTLQALAIDDSAESSYNADLAEQGQTFGVVWIPVDPATAHDDALRKGAARFNRLEGADFAGGAFWFDDTAGGEQRLGQVYRLVPGPEDKPGADILELFYEGTDATDIEAPDNLVVAPFGDIWFCEDGDGTDRVMGITPEAQVYPFARNALNDSELAGCTFSPDGQTFFVNIQSPGLTFAIWGPFPARNGPRQRQSAHAAPPAPLAPRISPELTEAAARYDLGLLEAAAYHRLGVPLLG